MRTLKTTLFVLVALSVGAFEAAAFEITMSARGATTSLTTSDTVIIDVFLDAETGLTLLSIGVLYPDDGTITYDGPASFALPPSSVGPSGALPSYILYGGSGRNATLLYPSVDNDPGTPGNQANYWNTWNGANQPNSFQVNLDFAEAGLDAAVASGTGIYIGSLVFVIEAGFTGGELTLCATCGGNTVLVGGPTGTEEKLNTTLSGTPITLTPEPAMASLAAVALGTLAVLRARRRRA